VNSVLEFTLHKLWVRRQRHFGGMSVFMVALYLQLQRGYGIR